MWAWKKNVGLKNRQKTIYDISLMIYLKNLWTVESWLLDPEHLSPFWSLSCTKDILRFRKGQGYNVDLLEQETFDEL